jgi:hypothetical protein
MIVRPENVRVSEQAAVTSGWNAVPVQVLDVSHLGSSTRVDFRFSDGAIGTARLDADPTIALRSGDTAWASWSPQSQRFVVPDREGAKRVEVAA